MDRLASRSEWRPTSRRTICAKSSTPRSHLINDPHTPLAKILELVPGPDFPTGGFILGRPGHSRLLHAGRGSVKVRAKAAIEKFGKESRSDRRD